MTAEVPYYPPGVTVPQAPKWAQQLVDGPTVSQPRKEGDPVSTPKPAKGKKPPPKKC